MKKIVPGIVMICCTIGFASCGCLNRGVIVDKNYKPSRTLYANGVYNQTKERFQIIVEGENSNDRLRKKKSMFRNKRLIVCRLETGTQYSNN